MSLRKVYIVNPDQSQISWSWADAESGWVPTSYDRFGLPRMARKGVDTSLKSRRIVFDSLERAQQYVAEASSFLHLRRGYFTFNASLIFHADIAAEPNGGEPQPLWIENIISVHRATMAGSLESQGTTFEVPQRLRDINLRPAQQSKYEAIATKFIAEEALEKKASGKKKSPFVWKTVCNNMLNTYDVWYRYRSHRHFATEIRNALNNKSAFEMDKFLSEIQQKIPLQSWDNDFYGMLTAMRTMFNIEFKNEVRNNLQVEQIPNDLIGLIQAYDGPLEENPKKLIDSSVPSPAPTSFLSQSSMFARDTSAPPSEFYENKSIDTNTTSSPVSNLSISSVSSVSSVGIFPSTSTPGQDFLKNNLVDSTTPLLPKKQPR